MRLQLGSFGYYMIMLRLQLVPFGYSMIMLASPKF